MKLIVIIICVQYITLSKQDLFPEKSQNRINYDLVKATNFIIENIFQLRFSTVNIVSSFENPSEYYFLDFKNALIMENKKFCIFRLDNYTRILGIKNRLKIYNIFILDSFKSFEILYGHISPVEFNYRGCYLFILINGRFKELNLIFSAMWKKGIINVNAMYEEGDSIQLATFTPFNEESCGSTEVVILDTLKNGKFNIEISEIFPKKLENGFGCPIRMVTFDRCPAACVKITGNETTVEGFDIAIIDLIAELLNFKLNKTIIVGPEAWGNVFPNGTTSPKGNGIEKILNNETDITIGNYWLRSSRVNLMDNSEVYYSFPVLFAIPSGDPYTAFEKLLRPFEMIVWILLLVTLCVGLLVILLLSFKWRQLRSFVYGTGIKYPIINM